MKALEAVFTYNEIHTRYIYSPPFEVGASEKKSSASLVSSFYALSNDMAQDRGYRQNVQFT